MNSNARKPNAGKALNHHLVALGIALLIVSIVYFETFRSMVGIWIESETFVHGFIILPLSAYLIWRKWSHLKTIPPGLSVPGIVLVFAISTAWFAADVLGMQVGRQITATAIILATVLSIMGASFTRAITFPLGYLFFAVPFGTFWVPGLQEITADFAVGLLRLTGIPVYRDGLFLSIPAGNFEVAKACSGIRYLLATLALGTLYAYLNYQKFYKRLIFIAFSFVMPIIANGIRAYGIIAIAHYSNMKYAIGVDHIIYGWIFFGIVIVLMFVVGNRFRDDDSPYQGSVSVEIGDTRLTRSGSRLAFAVLAVAGATTFGPLASQGLASKSSQESELSNGLPIAVAEWQGTLLPDSDWSPSFIGATQEMLVQYQGPEAQVDVAVVRYARQRQGSELANILNSIVGSSGWRRRNTRTLTLRLDDGKSVELFETRAIKHGQVRRFWYWYEVDGKIAASSIAIKLYEAHSLVTGRPAISSVIIVSVIEDSRSDDVLEKLMNDAYGPISECLGATEPQPGCGLGRTNTEIN